MKTTIAISLVAMFALTFVPTGVADKASDGIYARATTIDTPAGTYYLYVYQHGFNIYQETNNHLTGTACDVVEGLPVAHVPFGPEVPTMGMSGLQLYTKACGFAPDTKVA